jgi:hypothetical protein
MRSPATVWPPVALVYEPACAYVSSSAFLQLLVFVDIARGWRVPMQGDGRGGRERIVKTALSAAATIIC